MCCQIDLVIYPLWPRSQCSHIGCPFTEDSLSCCEMSPCFLFLLKVAISQAIAQSLHAQRYRSSLLPVSPVDWYSMIASLCAQQTCGIWLTHGSACPVIHGSVFLSSHTIDTFTLKLLVQLLMILVRMPCSHCS